MRDKERQVLMAHRKKGARTDGELGLQPKEMQKDMVELFCECYEG